MTEHGHRHRHKQDLCYMVRDLHCLLNNLLLVCISCAIYVQSCSVTYQLWWSRFAWFHKHAGNQLLHIHCTLIRSDHCMEQIVVWWSAHPWLASRSLKGLEKWKTSFFQRPASWQATEPSSSCALPFKIHCSILPARRPSGLPATM
jgi:hypothetical protein